MNRKTWVSMIMGVTLLYWLAVFVKVYRTAGEVAPSDDASSTRAALSLSNSFQLTKGNYYPGELWLDTEGIPINAHGGGILYHEKDETFYWYGEHKAGETRVVDPRYPARLEVMGVSCYSSKDLLNWKPEGIVLKPAKQPKHDLHASKVVERPKVLYNKLTDTFVMWMHVDTADYKYARTGVAVSARPTGPFEYAGSFRPHGQESRDMTVFEDPKHEGVAWLVYSSEDNMVTHIGRLSEDYRSTSGPWVRTLLNLSREAPAVFYHNEMYFLLTSGCTGWKPNQAEVFVAESMLGPWNSLGDPTRGGSKDLRESTFESQASFVLPLPGMPGRMIMLADRWNEHNLSDSRYVWLPVWVQETKFSAFTAAMSKREKMLWTSVVVGWFDSWNIPMLNRFPGII